MQEKIFFFYSMGKERMLVAILYFLAPEKPCGADVSKNREPNPATLPAHEDTSPELYCSIGLCIGVRAFCQLVHARCDLENHAMLELIR